jgi:formylglycine-generating enzyme required for sulfatase activity/predicted ATPase
LSALAQLDRQQHLVLLGDPGSGKSTFMQFIALCLAGDALEHEGVNLALLTAPLPDDQGDDQDEAQPWQHGRLLPCLVILRDFAARGLPAVGETATANHLWQFITAELEAASLADFAQPWQQEWLDEGGILLLDGLDEVPQANQRRQQIKQVIEDFAATYPQLRIVVTSRTYAYQQQEWHLPDFATAVLAPFTPGQIRRFVNRWYVHLAPLRGWHSDDAQGRAELLKQAIFNSERLHSLAERPLLLTLMASLHAWRGGSLPEKREELYADTVDLLLDWWENQRVVRDARGEIVIIQPSLAEWLKIDREKVRRLLHHLAYEAHAAQPELVGTADIAEGTLVVGLMRLNQNPDANDVNPVRLVEYLTDRAGLLLPRGVGIYTFPHRTFQEYLAACYLTDHDYPDTVAELVCADPNRWREVALLAGAKAARGTASSLWSLIEALCYQEPEEQVTEMTEAALAAAWGAHLAGQALVEIAQLDHITPRHQAKVERVKKWLINIIQGSALPATERAKAAVHLADLGDSRVEVMTTKAMPFCFVPPGPFWLGSDEDNPVEKDAERPLHQVELPYGYWLARFPVTNAQFAEFVTAQGYQNEAYWVEAAAHGFWGEGQTRGYTWIPETQKYEEQWRDSPYEYGRPFNLPNHPVVGLTWYESLAFTRWLMATWQQAGLLSPEWQVSLPSEAEWEKAARGGLEIPLRPYIADITVMQAAPDLDLKANPQSQRRYIWGDTAADPEWANYEGTGIGSSNGCGCFASTATVYGCEEMAGNILEWTRTVWGKYDREKSETGKPVFDPFYTYPYAAEDGREKLSHDDWWPRVLRGGVWAGDETWLRCAFRGPGTSRTTGPLNLGIRVVVVPIFP